jgi:exodeoxyribonuclease VII large subunit
MSEPLFQPKDTTGAPAAEPEGIFSVTQYNKSLERLLKTQVPKVWVKGVITQLNVRGRVVYLTLGEFAEGDTRPRAVVDTFFWASELELYNARFSLLPMPFQLRPELKVAVRLEANFYVPSGRFQPRILSIDESFTVGELSITRAKILQKLVAEGLAERNKLLTLTEVPLKIGLITSPGSAAYQDFTTVLLQSGFSFEIVLAEARMQGNTTEATVVKAINRLAKETLDVICLIRGGGSKTDLVYFDSEAICRAIALCPIPVITGIGHEIDRSLADVVAHADLLTPTDCAKFLEGRAQEALGSIQECLQSLFQTVEGELDARSRKLDTTSEALRRIWGLRASGETVRTEESAERIRAAALRSMQEQDQKLRRSQLGLLRGPRKFLDLQSARYQQKGLRLQGIWDKLRTQALGELLARITHLRSGGGAWLGRWRERLLPRPHELKRSMERMVSDAQKNEQFLGKRLDASDPRRILARGYAFLADEAGQTVRSVAALKKGDAFRARLADGMVEGVIEKTESKKWKKSK